MALTDIIAKIDEDARVTVERIREEAREKAEALLERARAEAREVANVGKSDAERAATKARGRIIAGATHETKFLIQAFRASLIRRVFEEAETLLSKLPEKEYSAFIVSRARGLSGHSGVLTLSLEREKETREALKNENLKAEKIRIVHTGELLGGFVFETETAVFDRSIRAAMAEARERYTGDVAQKLFAN